MLTEEIWKGLEADSAAGESVGSGWLLRLAKPSANCPLFVGLELSSRRRAILLRLPQNAVPPRRNWPRSTGLEPLAVIVGGKAHFGVALKESRFSDVFGALVEDLIRRVTDATNATAQTRAFLGQLSRWQKFLSVSSEGLSEQAQRGLWGELHLLREHLLTLVGTIALAAWKGSQRAHQDYQFQNLAVEVKTTVTKQPQVIRITSERQLDNKAWDALFLNVITLEMRDGNGQTLPEMIASVRAKLIHDPKATELLEDELLSVGYFEAHVSRYAERGYSVRSDDFFRVRSGFPRLVEDDMPSGVGDANYALSVASCEAFKIKPKSFYGYFKSEILPKSKRKNNV